MIYTGGDKGWVGESPFLLFNINNILNIGWKLKYTIQENIVKTTKYLIKYR